MPTAYFTLLFIKPDISLRCFEGQKRDGGLSSVIFLKLCHLIVVKRPSNDQMVGTCMVFFTEEIPFLNSRKSPKQSDHAAFSVLPNIMVLMIH